MIRLALAFSTLVAAFVAVTILPGSSLL